ncbi:MAG: GWxTD domain-containing protein [Chryseosolibacter sp.]
MKKFISFALLILAINAVGQPLRDINYAYLYDPDEAFSFTIKPVRNQGSFTILYNLQVRDTAGFRDDYVIEWQSRTMLSDKEGVPLSLDAHVSTTHKSGLQGRGTISMVPAPKYIVAKVVKNSWKRAWVFYAPLEEKLPVNNYLVRKGVPVIESYVHHDERVSIALDSGGFIVSQYDDNFPAAAPAFSEAQARVSRGMAIDSVYAIDGGREVNFPGKGLYLIQKDTNALEGFAFRVEEDYPQYTKLVSLPGPLIYITTKQEYDRLISVQGNKKAFDRVILSITADTERARTLMRSYFRRVELANRYFTSYKEGWKTDRGMIYIIFGKPAEVYKFNDREVWSYKNNQFEIRFTFSKSSSLFDPDNYVLIREKKHERTWYEVIDLWRNARF